MAGNATETELLIKKYNDISDGVWYYGSPILILFGTAGNILSFLVMNRPKLKPTTFSFYLRAVAVCDTLFLWLGAFQKWGMAGWKFDYSTLSNTGCKVREFFYLALGDVAIWVILALTLDRTITVLRASSRPNFSIPQIYGLITVVFITLVATAKNCHLFFTRGLMEKSENGTSFGSSSCTELPEYKYFEDTIRPWIFAFSVNIIPVIWLSICNMIIITKLLQLRKQQSALKGGSAMNKKMKQTIIMCLTISFSFLVLVTPTVILLVGKKYWKGSKTEVRTARYRCAQAFANYLILMNHAINFYLYCVSGKSFREELKKMFIKRSDTDEANGVNG